MRDKTIVKSQNSVSIFVSRKCIFLFAAVLCSIMDIADSRLSGEVVEGPRIGGMGIGVLVMVIVISIALVLFAVLHFHDETAWGCFFSILITLIVFGILMVCPKGPVIEEAEGEYELDEDKDGTFIMTLTLLIFMIVCSLISLWIFCYYGLLSETKPGKHDFSLYQLSRHAF